MSESLHALLSPSAAARWMACAPSAILESTQKESTSKYADEGTCAHAIAADWLQQLLDGKAGVAWEDYHPGVDLLQDTLDNGFSPVEISQDVQPYVANVWAAYREACEIDWTAKLYIEQRVSLDRWNEHCWGTADAIVSGLGTLHVFDLKYGKGVRVNAFHNPQLMIYALGAVDLIPTAYIPKEITMTIDQVRLQHRTDYTIMSQALLDWGRTEFAPAAQLAADCDGQLTVGPHCKFCRIAGRCPALAALSTILEAEFGDPSIMNGKQLATVIPLIPAIRTWCDRAENVALGLAMQGNPVPGTKLVEGRSVTRCVNPVGAMQALKEAGLPEEAYCETSLKSLTAIKKALGKEAYEAVMGPYIAKPQGKPTIAPVDDPRPELTVNLDSEFGDI